MITYRNRFKHLLILIKHYLNIYIMESIRRKLVITLLIVMTVPLVIFLILSTNIARGTVGSSEISSNIARVDLSSHYIEYQLKEYDQLLFSALVDDLLVPSLMKVDDINTTNMFNTQNYIKDKLFNMYNSRESIRAISLVSYDTGNNYRITDNEFFIESYSNLPQYTKSKDVIFGIDEESNSFFFERNIYRFEDQKLIGKIKMNINFSLFDPIIKNLQSNEGEHVILLSSSGDILYNPDNTYIDKSVRKQMVTKRSRETEVTLEENLYLFQNKLNQNIFLLKMVPVEVMNIGASYIQKSGIIILIISIILTVILSIYVSNKVTKPVIELSKAMEKIGENNFDVQIKTTGSDEISHLRRKYKEMIGRIRNLIEKDYKREIEKKDAQFLALQAQINPHFLYNTLQVIGGMAIKKDVKEINDVTQTLSDVFRYITKKQDGLVYLYEEVNHLKNYIHIQQLRFQDKISIHLFVDNEVNDELIPLLTIQPLIENCFIHGFDSKVDDCIIKIDIQKVFDEIEIIVEDNGSGISEIDLIRIRENLASGQFVQGERIGINNVNNRIKLYFGDEYGIDLYSEKNKYTKVIMRLPYQKKGVGE
ncbi:sensor histidine kinase [Lederbergia lenta]|uniref:sensor histidine kinase n=1 Tax=Lederbergia lenta TaxID=1467 RepID=UPI0020410AA8|nr:sensor histidine kinase [Lederbergia lenta]MCM3111712.1 sensor histidine kinase [Lederbergia lenta]